MKAKLASELAFFLACSILLTIVTSCSQKNKYSCDDEVNQWVTSHLKDLQDLTRTDLAKYPLNYQVAIYRSLSAENKAAI